MRPRPSAPAAGSSAAAPTRARTAPGATKAAVLAALKLKDGSAITAGEIAAATGLGRATTSTTLSKLAKSGEITKAARGYQIPHKTDAPALESAGEAGYPAGSGRRVERHRCRSRDLREQGSKMR
ncbi:MAG: MarR family transcriptional regulator [Solirubrobacteraceae bacterium]